MAIKSADQITIIDVTDAYSVILTSEAYTFVGGVSGAAAGATCSTQAVAYCGSNAVSAVYVTEGDVVCPSGISAKVTGSGTPSPTITFTTTSTVANACEATIPVRIGEDITINKKFSFAVAKTGATGAKGDTGASGVSVTGISTQYLASASSSGVTTSTSGWTATMQTTTATNKYLWMYQTISYSSGNPTTTTPIIIGTHGTTGSTGAQGVGVKSIANKYLTTSSNTGVTTSTSGWADTPTATTTSNRYIWCYQIITYSDNTTSNTTPAIIGTHGATGAKGEDAIAIQVTSSNGTIFKNNTGSTVLTAHVYVGGVEQTVNDNGTVSGYGTIKWYRGNSTSGTAGKTMTVAASDVDSTLVYTCQLEA